MNASYAAQGRGANPARRPNYAMNFRWHDIDADPQGWDRLVAQTHQSLFNLAPMLAVHAYEGARRRGVLLLEQGEPIGLVGGLLRQTPAGGSFESLCFPVLPMPADAAVLDDLVRWLHAQGCAQIRFGSFDGGVEHYPVDCTAFTVSERLEFPWDLTVSEDQRRKLLRSNHKRKLQKLAKQELQVRRIERHQAWTLTRARAQWAERKGERLRLRRLLRMWRYHRLLHRHLTRAGLANLYGLYAPDGTLLSVAYMLEYGGLSFYMIGASSPEGYRLSASMRLFWDMARSYSDQGFRYLHLGGVPTAALAEEHEEHGVYRFKHGFGIEPAVRLTLSTHR
jgi:hypothetical protein